MPYETVTQKTITPAVKANRWKITKITLSPVLGTISIVYSPGVFSDGNVAWGDATTHERLAEPYASASCDGSLTQYEGMKQVAYKILKDDGVMPSGGTVA